MTHKEIVFSIKDDVIDFCERKGGFWKRVQSVFEGQIKKMEEQDAAEKKKKEQEDEDERPSEESAEEDDFEIDAEPEVKKTEVSQEVLDSIFGKDDDEADDEDQEDDEEHPEVK